MTERNIIIAAVSAVLAGIAVYEYGRARDRGQIRRLFRKMKGVFA